MLKIESISFSYFKKKILDNISFNIKDRDFTGIIGPNGAGKTTLFKLITGILKPQSGSIFINGNNIRDINNFDLARQIAFMPQFFDVSLNYSVKDFVLMGRFPYLKRFDNLSCRDFEIAEECLFLTDTEDLSARFFSTLSAGEKQRVFLAQALAQQPKILLLDEPTAHLDIGHQGAILNVIKKLNKEKNITVVTVMHDLNLTSEYCDNVILMDKGKVVGSGNPENVLHYSNIRSVYNANVSIEKSPNSKKSHIFLMSD